MDESAIIWLEEAKNTHSCGVSLAQSLYGFPLDIILRGDLGAGKTTFIQGFASGLGIKDALRSPTYSLEDRYRILDNPLPLSLIPQSYTKEIVPFLHIDLYRLKANEAEDLLSSSSLHQGIRCIEWGDRSTKGLDGSYIDCLFRERRERDSSVPRELSLSFQDFPLPSDTQINTWREEVKTPENVRQHCDAVSSFAQKLADHVLQHNRVVRKDALQKAAQLHDLLRFIDFHPQASPEGVTIPQDYSRTWKQIQKRYEGLGHEEACASFVSEKGYRELGAIIAVHGLHQTSPERITIEQQLLFYADKRVLFNSVVSLEERFDDFAKRYSNGIRSPQHEKWFSEVRTLEKDLFPDGPL
jgi:tRNA threonylcarbamoyladenosine biosynthesis protein TsaE